MKLRPRLMGLLAVMVASLAFAMLDRGSPTVEDTPPTQARTENKTAASREPRTTAPPSQTPVDTLAPAAAPDEVDLFAAKRWYVAPPPPPPPKPEAPPFPYTVTGSAVGLGDGDDITLFLSQGERNFIVKKGDIVGGSYRLDDIADGRAEFTYLPLKQRQHLQIGKIN